MFYKILNTKTGLYSKGGLSAITDDSWAWSKDGKVWRNKRALMLHLAQFKDGSGGPGIPEHWLVVSFKTVEAGPRVPARQFA